MLRKHLALVVLAAAEIICLPVSARAQVDKMREVVETYPDGSVKVKYRVDVNGKKSGLFLAYFENGKVKLRARYSKDVLHGSYQSHHPDGSRAISTRYRNGKLHGSYKKHDAEGHCLEVAEYRSDYLAEAALYARPRELPLAA